LPKHPKRKHVEQQVAEPTVHEQVGDDLVWFKEHGADIVQGKKVLKIERRAVGKRHL
jgi:hypothetical protein